MNEGYSSRNSTKNTNERPTRASFFILHQGQEGASSSGMVEAKRSSNRSLSKMVSLPSFMSIFVSVPLAAVPVTCPAGIINTSLPSGQHHHETPRYLPGLELAEDSLNPLVAALRRLLWRGSEAGAAALP